MRPRRLKIEQLTARRLLAGDLVGPLPFESDLAQIAETRYDVNRDQQVSLGDAIEVTAYLRDQAGEFNDAADVNADGTVAVDDALAVVDQVRSDSAARDQYLNVKQDHPAVAGQPGLEPVGGGGVASMSYGSGSGTGSSSGSGCTVGSGSGAGSGSGSGSGSGAGSGSGSGGCVDIRITATAEDTNLNPFAEVTSLQSYEHDPTVSLDQSFSQLEYVTLTVDVYGDTTHFNVSDWQVSINATNVEFWDDVTRETSLSIGSSIPLSEFDGSGTQFTYDFYFDSGGVAATSTIEGTTFSTNPFVSDLTEEFYKITAYYDKAAMKINEFIVDEVPGFTQNTVEAQLSSTLNTYGVQPLRTELNDLIDGFTLDPDERDNLIMLRDNLDGYLAAAVGKAGDVVFGLVDDAVGDGFLPILSTLAAC